jgi:hypothetical protein
MTPETPNLIASGPVVKQAKSAGAREYREQWHKIADPHRLIYMEGNQQMRAYPKRDKPDKPDDAQSVVHHDAAKITDLGSGSVK